MYGEIRRKFGDLESEEDLVKFFSEVLEERDRPEEEETEQMETTSGAKDTADEASGGPSSSHASMGS